MLKITAGVLTVSDRCSNHMAVDESGKNLCDLLSREKFIKDVSVCRYEIVPDERSQIRQTLADWCDRLKLSLIITTGGTGVSPRDVTPQATASILDWEIPGIPNLIFKRSSEITPLAALSRGIAGVRKTSLIINLPGSKKASEECLEAVACVIPHAIDLIHDIKNKVEVVHAALQLNKSRVRHVGEDERVRVSPYKSIKVCEAQAIIRKNVVVLRKEKYVKFEDALGYVIATEVKAFDNLPPFDASIRDGYAVKSDDKTTIKTLVGTCAAGATPDVTVVPGSCVSVNTGAPIPPGADAIVQVEDTFVEEHGTVKRIGIKTSPAPGEHIRPKGSDFKKDATLMSSGTYLNSSALGLLAAAGILNVKVYEKPTVTVFSTGDEIVDPHSSPGPSKVRDSNRIAVCSMLKEEGYHADELGIVEDDPDALYTALRKGFESHDVVVTTGSMSMGDKDYLKAVLKTDFDAEIFFGAVAMKPGKPTAFAKIEYLGKPKFWFGLPGNPASAVVTTHLFLLPALRVISGCKNELPPRVDATLLFDIALLERFHYHRGVLKYKNGGFEISSTGNQSSSWVGSCLEANCLIEIPEGTGYVRSGSRVTALVIDKHF